MFLKICIILIGSLASVTCNDHEDGLITQLIDTLYNYGQKIKLPEENICNNLSNGNGYQNGLISKDVFQCFEDEMIFILGRINSIFWNKLSDARLFIRQSKEIDNQKTQLMEIPVLLKTNKLICSLLPGCANFINIYRENRSLTCALHHGFTCGAMPDSILQYCAQDNNYSEFYEYSYKLQSKIDRMIKSIHFYLHQFNINMHDAIDFIKTVHKLTEEIFKIRMPVCNQKNIHKILPDDEYFRVTLTEIYPMVQETMNSEQIEIHNNEQVNIIRQFMNSDTFTKCISSTEFLNRINIATI